MFVMKIIRIIVALCLCWLNYGFAAEVNVVGFAFAGDFKSAAERFPYTYKLFKDSKGQYNKTFSSLVNVRMKQVVNPVLEFKSGSSLVNLKNSDQALMAVLVLTGETVATDYFGSYYKTFVNLRGDALIFDYKGQTIVRSYPVSVVLFDATAEKPSEVRISSFVDELIRREDGRGLVTQFVRRMETATLPKEGTKTVQVRKGVILPDALALMPESLRKNKAALDTMIADSFASILSAKVGISLIPSSIGHAIGGVMSMYLENGDDYRLKVGEGDYLFDVSLNKFAKIKASENKVGTVYVYGAYTTIRFYEPALNTVYLDSDIKNGESAIVPVGQISSDDFAAYQDAIRGLYLKLSDAFVGPSTKWITTAASANNIESQLNSTREILRSCK